MKMTVKPRLSPSTYVGMFLLGGFVIAAILGPIFAPYDPEVQNLESILASSSSAHWFGTDQNGSDLLSQLLHGARLALIISVSVVGLCATIGVLIGVISGYYGGWVDGVIMRIVDLLMAFPGTIIKYRRRGGRRTPWDRRVNCCACCQWMGWLRESCPRAGPDLARTRICQRSKMSRDAAAQTNGTSHHSKPPVSHSRTDDIWLWHRDSCRGIAFFLGFRSTGQLHLGCIARSGRSLYVSSPFGRDSRCCHHDRCTWCQFVG